MDLQDKTWVLRGMEEFSGMKNVKAHSASYARCKKHDGEENLETRTNP